jgi:Helix-turn-helix domain
MPTMPNEYQHQLRDILRELQRGRRLTVAVALSELGVYALSQRIGELRRLGWPIDRIMIRTSGGATVAEYYLAAPRDRAEPNIDVSMALLSLT